MDYSGPEKADFANVRSLNSAFLSILRGPLSGAALRQQLPASLRQRFADLTDLHLEHLAEAPYLLMSFRERDDDFWSLLTVDEPNLDLLQPEQAQGETERLVAAGLGFLWQLAQRNPYAARLVSGASLGWCERLADSTLLNLLRRAACHRDLPELRFAGAADIWNKLLGTGISARPEVRAAAQLSVLQSMLTTDPADRYRRMRAAACAAPDPARRYP